MRQARQMMAFTVATLTAVVSVAAVAQSTPALPPDSEVPGSFYCSAVPGDTGSSGSNEAAANEHGATTQCSLLHESVWHNGFVATYEVTNTGTEAISDWQVQLQLGAGQQISNLWNGNLDAEAVLVNNADWNGTIYPGESASFGFQASYNGDYSQPVCSTATANTPPHIEFTVEQNGLTVFVDASASHDPDGDTLEFQIAYDAYETHDRISSSWHTFYSPGDYEVTVTVSDGTETRSETRLISVVENADDNVAPVANLEFDVSGETVAVHTNLSLDENEDTLTKIFSKDIRNGIAHGTLTVSDGELGDTDQAAVWCSAFFDFTPIPTFRYWVEGTTVVFDARDSIAAYRLQWNLGDETVLNNAPARVTHTYSEPGQYEIDLFARAGAFGSSKSATINVDNGINNPPVADLECWQRKRGDDMTWMECRAIGAFDADRDPLLLTWDMGDGYSYTTTNLEEPVSHVYSEDGNYQVTLQVSDGQSSDDASTGVNFEL